MTNSAPDEPATATVGRRRLLRYVAFLAPFLGLVLIDVFFAGCDLFGIGNDNEPWVFERLPRLHSAYNLKLIAAQTSIVAVAALGMTLVIISGGIDLSPGSSIALTTTVIAVALKSGIGPLGALALGVVCASFVGLLNGVAITGLRIVPFIVTLGMMGIARGVAKWLGGEKSVYPPRTWLNKLLHVDSARDAALWSLPAGVVFLVLVGVTVHLVLRYSVFGRYVFAIGSNEATARLCGVNVWAQKVAIYMLAGLLTGLAGVLHFGRLAIGDPTTAVGMELDIIASVVIGGGSLSGGKGSVLGTIVGALVMGVLRNGCDLFGIPNYVQEIFIGLIIIAAVGVDQVRRRRAG